MNLTRFIMNLSGFIVNPLGFILIISQRLTRFHTWFIMNLWNFKNG